jgi:hypothetical protein
VKPLRALLTATVASLALCAAAFAAPTVTTPATASFSVTLNGVDRTGTYTVAMTLANTGGTAGSGWNITAAASQFTTGGGKTLPATATQVTGVADDASCAGGGCNNPTNAVTWPVTLGAAAVKIYNAAAGTGKGTNVETGTFTVDVPSNAFAGTYTSTLTVSTVSGP